MGYPGDSSVGRSAQERPHDHPSPRARVAWAAPLMVLLGLVVAGCAPRTLDSHSWSRSAPGPATNAAPAGSPTSSKPPVPKPTPVKPVTLSPGLLRDDRVPRYPVLTAVERSVGRVVTVNTQALFVVVDFGFNPLPRPDQRLTVFRTNHAVGSVRMTGAPRGSLMAADIMSGEAEVGDEVREH